MKIVIAGGTGQVGHILAIHFHQEGHSVTVLSRKPHRAPWRVIPWTASPPAPGSRTSTNATRTRDSKDGAAVCWSVSGS
jgi:NAD dependent epimerase/dehydratase family enzyme